MMSYPVARLVRCRRSPSTTTPVPPGVLLDLGEALRGLEVLEDALAAIEEARLALGLQDEIAAVIRALHVRPGFDEGGLR
jgi:hypothetical protein